VVGAGVEREQRALERRRTGCAAPAASVLGVLLVVAATERELALLDGLETFCCGIGPVEAALQTARALQERRPDAVVHAGIAGARTLEPPALVLGSEAVYSDVIDPASTLPRVERVRPDAALLERARASLPEARVLPIATCGKVGGGTGFDVEAMEGFGVLRACELSGVPAVELRAISNSPDESDRARWRFDEAFAALAEALQRLDVL
jgi:futalosine hydrolase